MTVSRAEVEQMANLKAILEGRPAAYEAKPQSPTPSAEAATARIDPGIAAMRSILERFNDATEGIDSATQALVQDAGTDRSLRTALMTEATDAGVSVGAWEIRVKSEGARRFYDVVRIAEGEVLAADLTLYEAAYGIARELAEGRPFTTRLVRDILNAEAAYAAAVSDAIHFKHALTKTALTEQRRAVTEDRYSVAKQRAATARHHVERLTRPLPF